MTNLPARLLDWVAGSAFGLLEAVFPTNHVQQCIDCGGPTSVQPCTHCYSAASLVNAEAEAEVDEPAELSRSRSVYFPLQYRIPQPSQYGRPYTIDDISAMRTDPAASATADTSPVTPPAGDNDPDEAPPGTDASAGSPTFIDWATPAICDVLATHEPDFDASRGFRCRELENPWKLACLDWQEWREHVAPKIAERIESALLHEFPKK